ncbi:MAG: DUF2911 domain-containing protein [Chitinophagaceae bacterium]
MKLLSIFLAVLFLISCANEKEKDSKEVVAPSTIVVDTVGKIIAITRPGELDTVTKSIKAIVTKKINDLTITISYHSPAVRNRVIWGGLVPFDQVWVAGAHMATSIEFNKRLTINGKKIPAGKYALFAIPSQKEWTLILNRNWQQHLTDKYDIREDVLRVMVKPDTINYLQERLRYDIIEQKEGLGAIEFRWEKLLISVPIK